MAYDSKTYGQSPFGSPKKPDGPNKSSNKTEATAPSSAPSKPVIDNGLDRGPGEVSPTSRPTVKPSPFPTVSASASAVTNAEDQAAQPGIPASVSQLVSKLGISQSVLDKVSGLAEKGLAGSESIGTSDRLAAPAAKETAAPASKRRSRTTAKSQKTASKSGRKSKKSKAEVAQSETAAAEAEVARRFQAEDQRTYISLLYKTGVSGLVWSVLRLSRYELPEDAIAIINIIIHPLLIGTLAFVTVVILTFWLRRLLNDLARHTQQLHTDAEISDGKNYRPTLEIVGDSLEYNPKLRQNFARLFDVASILICTLVSYLVTILPFIKLA